MKPVVFSLLASQGAQAQSLAENLGCRHICANENTAAQLSGAFLAGHPIIAHMATGIIIRALAPHLAHKHKDAPVIAVTPGGQHVIPLLGGHHGANALARQIAQITGGVAAVSTAGDCRFGIALDEPPPGYSLTNVVDYKPFMASLLAGEKIRTSTLADWLAHSTLPFADDGILKITVSDKAQQGASDHLVYAPHSLYVGVGCERGTDAAQVIELVESCLQSANLSASAIAAFVSIDLKADETALHQLAQHFGKPVRFFSAKTLNEQADRLENPSQIVFEEVGCPGVAEGAALAAGGPESKLIVAKTKSQRATCAITRSANPVTKLAGRRRGKLCVVGIGPGSLEWRSPHASRALDNASDWVGYGLYLDLAADLKTSQKEHRFDLGKEEARVRHSLMLAAQGRDVALVCSGDAAIYAMAALVYEVLDSDDLDASAKRVEIDVVPGISAFQAASARAGALIGHDFCTISLSDLLTPWQTIENRLHAAAKGDFNIAFYNPRSLKRTDQLSRAIEILIPHRPPDTPVIVASNLGRPSEAVNTTTLQEFQPQDVDMLTIVLVGSSQSRLVKRGDGKTYCYTPRGYANKTTPSESS